MRFRHLAPIAASVTLTAVSLMGLSSCAFSSKKADHEDVLAAVKSICAESDALSAHVPDDNLSESEQASEMARLTEKYNKNLKRFLALSASDANDKRLIEQISRAYKAIRAVDPQDDDSTERVGEISAQLVANIKAAGEDFACLNT